jgi:hypothetical protein
VDCPPQYGAPKTIYSRFNRWSGRRIWQIDEVAALRLKRLIK